MNGPTHALRLIAATRAIAPIALLAITACGTAVVTPMADDPLADATFAIGADDALDPWPDLDAGSDARDHTDAGDHEASSARCRHDAGAGACTPVLDGCGPVEVCGNGLDDNCDGAVDEGCACSPGAVQRCFAGPPGRRSVGVCSDGTQVCRVSSDGARWGACSGGIAPGVERCDHADNDCDGCIDANDCCDTRAMCPGADDMRVPPGAPFVPYVLHGASFFVGTARSWHWHVEGGPCDQLMWATSGHVSYTLNGSRRSTLDAHGETLRLTPSLSGDYRVTLDVVPDSGRSVACTFMVHVRAPGMRVELCWDRTGDTDLDLWLHDPRNARDWAQTENDDTCAYYNCRNARSGLSGAPLDWHYAATPGGACREPSGDGSCANPRLDVDNVSSAGLPENVNVDAPRVGEKFRVAVNYYAGTGPVRPMVNVYCGGELRATMGGAVIAGEPIGGDEVRGFATAGANDHGSVWRVADVQMRGRDDCAVLALHGTGPNPAPCVETGTDRSFSGACR